MPDRILDAVDSLILESGGRGVTLDLVAARAGVSKGGLVYSFPTKDALLAAALRRELDQFERAIANRTGAGEAAGYFAAYLDEIMDEGDEANRKAAFLLTSLIRSNLEDDPSRAFYESLIARFDDRTEAGKTVRQAVLAVEGMLLLNGLGFVPFDAGLFRSVTDHARRTVASALL